MRLNKDDLLNSISSWNGFIKGKVRLVACGGTALTLLDVKESTKDVDLMVPEPAEYENLLEMLISTGYRQVTGNGWFRDEGFVFDLFRGKSIHTTELLDNPLEEGNSTIYKEFSNITLSTLNYYDLITSKLFRGTGVDYEDCLLLAGAKRLEINFEKLEKVFLETASFDVSEDKVVKNFKYFKDMLRKKGISYVK